MPELKHWGLVSVVIPTFNQANFLADALECVRRQTYQAWEAIVINNFSSDDTVSIITSLNDDRIRLINFANDGVIARSRNIGIKESHGEFVAFLDSDDLWEDEKLTRCVEVLNRGVDLVCHAERWFGGGSLDRIVKYGPKERATYTALLAKGNCISTSATVVRREVLEALGGFRDSPEFVTTEDYDLWLRIAKHKYRIDFIDESLGSFRRHSSSASSATLRHLKAELAVLSDHFSSAPHDLHRYERRRRAFAHYTAARGFSKGNSYLQALRMFGIALWLRPRSIRTWIGLLAHIVYFPIRTLQRQMRNDQR